jgi:acyl-CoA reductase-like NAD-dependent aldehyde dehydrogenase
VASITGAGCSVVLKASELSPKTHHMLAEAFIEAGVPSGVINVIQMGRDNAPAVTGTLIDIVRLEKLSLSGVPEWDRRSHRLQRSISSPF